MTALPETKRALVEDLDRRVRTLPSWKAVLPATEAPGWYGRLLTSYALLADDEPILYLTGQLEEAEGRVTASLISFTTSYLVRAKVWGSTETDDVKIAVNAAARSGLVLMGVSGSTSASDKDAATPWPGNLTFTLTYRSEGDALALPLDIPEDKNWQAEQAALLAGLRVDLRA